MMNAHTPETSRLIRRLFFQHQFFTMFGSPSLVYLLAIILGYNAEEARVLVGYVTIPVLMPFLGAIIPYFSLRRVVNRAYSNLPGDPPEGRLVRILEIPGNIEVTMAVMNVVGVAIILGVSVLKFNKGMGTALWALVNYSLLVLLLHTLERRAFEDTLRPYALEESKRVPNIMLRRSGFLWPRQAWLMPYTSGLFVACTLATAVSILGFKGQDAYAALIDQINHAPVGTTPAQFVQMARDTVGQLAGSLVLPVSLVGGYLVIAASLTAWLMARAQMRGSKSVQESLEGLAQGKPRLPEWVSTDEIGDMAAAATRVFAQLRSFSLALKDSAYSLQHSAERLGLSTRKQTEMLSVQASALQETHVTAEEIKNTSLVASQKAGNILQQADRANTITRSSELAVQQGLAGIEEIGSQVREMAKSIKSLEERARQVARVTSMVKDLADQSNMLALNAAIEAVRSGESGKGFGVVAKEIRSLADQSVHATNNIRTILQDIGSAITTATLLAAKGSQRVEASLNQVREFNEQVQQLSAIVGDTASSVRQITAAVTQQDAGISQITQAVHQLTGVMEQTMGQMRSSEEAISVVRGVAERVSDLVSSYGWKQEDDDRASPPPPPAEASVQDSVVEHR
ncbi:MAG TPA: methyl-accepting chemotaxis protein [Archangium sp.]|jgi:methyl-accepting chemotaxis protein|uniref:methyl-accepting chemotaxis protein n=1 Tax=Archangium sp. TaxID=1872627 RepID=UPI002EDA9996